MKKITKKKGFTLIELIVVIAILGILALIAVPRFSGFTNRAKIQTDKQQSAIVQNAAKALLASGDIVVSGTSADDTITLSRTTPFIAIGKGITKPSSSSNPSSTVLAMFQDTVEAKTLQYYTTIVITVEADGSCTVSEK